MLADRAKEVMAKMLHEANPNGLNYQRAIKDTFNNMSEFEQVDFCMEIVMLFMYIFITSTRHFILYAFVWIWLSKTDILGRLGAHNRRLRKTYKKKQC